MKRLPCSVRSAARLASWLNLVHGGRDCSLFDTFQSMAASKSHTLTPKHYSLLRQDIKKLLESGASSANQRRIEAYWEIGERIAEEKLTSEAGYHNSILRDLSKDTGASLRTLQRAVTLREYYPKPPVSKGLSWSHVRVLLQVSSSAQRKQLMKLALEEGLTSRELRAAIESSEEGASKDRALERPCDPTFLYRAEVHSVVDGDTLELDIDLGFHVFRRQRVRLASLNCPDVKTEKGRAAKAFVTEQVLSAPLVVVKTNKADIYGRYVAHVFLGKRGADIEATFREGVYLNSLLIEEKHARKAR